ncbi:protein cordon-bleu isoform X2 [Ambystoma mexicanum]
MKGRAPPPPVPPSALRSQGERKSSTDSKMAGDQCPEDLKENLLNRSVDTVIILPSGVEKTARVEGRKAMMDLLVELCSQYHLNPAHHVLQITSSASQVPIKFKPNTLIGTLDVHTVLLKEKSTEGKSRKPPPRVPEKSVRLVVNFLRTQKTVLRVNPGVPLQDLLPAICEKCELRQQHVALLRDNATKEPLDPSKSLNELGIKELYLWSSQKETDRSLAVRRDSTDKEKKGLLGIFKVNKRSKKRADPVVTRMDSDDADEEFFEMANRNVAGFAGFSTVPNSPSASTRTLGLGTSLSLSNISGMTERSEVKKRRAPPPPAGMTRRASGPEESGEDKRALKILQASLNDLQKKKRRAPAPPAPAMPNSAADEKENRNSTAGNGRPVPEKPPRGITPRAPPQLVLPPPPPYPPPDIMDPLAFQGGADFSDTSELALESEWQFAPGNSVYIDDDNEEGDDGVMDTSEVEESTSMYSCLASEGTTEDSGTVSSQSDITSLDYQNDRTRQRDKLQWDEEDTGQTDVMYTAKMCPVRDLSVNSDDSWTAPQSPVTRDEELMAVRSGEEDVFITAQFQQTLAELDEDSEGMEDNDYSTSGFSESSPTADVSSPYQYDTDSGTDVVVAVPVTIIDEVPDFSNYSSEHYIANALPSRRVMDDTASKALDPQAKLVNENNNAGSFDKKISPIRTPDANVNLSVSGISSANDTLAVSRTSQANGNAGLSRASQANGNAGLSRASQANGNAGLSRASQANGNAGLSRASQANGNLGASRTFHSYGNLAESATSHTNGNVPVSRTSLGNGSLPLSQTFHSYDNLAHQTSPNVKSNFKFPPSDSAQSNKSSFEYEDKPENTWHGSASQAASLEQKPWTPDPTEDSTSSFLDQNGNRSAWNKSKAGPDLGHILRQSCGGEHNVPALRWPQSYEPKPRLTTFKVVPSKPGVKQFDRGVSLSASAIKIDELGNLINPNTSVEKNDTIDSSVSDGEGSLVRRAKEFWRSNSTEKQVENTPEEEEKKPIPTPTNKARNQENENKQTFLTEPKQITTQLQTLPSKIDKGHSDLKVTHKSQVKMPPDPELNKARADLSFLKPYRRTSSQYVASAITRYAKTQRQSSEEELGPEDKNPALILEPKEGKCIILSKYVPVETQKAEMSGSHGDYNNFKHREWNTVPCTYEPGMENSWNATETMNERNKTNVSNSINTRLPRPSPRERFIQNIVGYDGGQETEDRRANIFLTQRCERSDVVDVSPAFESQDARLPRSPSGSFPGWREDQASDNVEDACVKPSYAMNSVPKSSHVTQYGESKPVALPRRISLESDILVGNSVFGPKKKFRPIVQKPAQKDMSLHTALMESIQSGQGKHRLRSVQDSEGLANGSQNKASFIETENERSALLSAIRAHSGNTRLRKVTSPASEELQNIRHAELQVQDKENRDIPSLPVLLPPPPPPPPPSATTAAPKFAATYAGKSANPREELLEAIRCGSNAGRLKKVSPSLNTL